MALWTDEIRVTVMGTEVHFDPDESKAVMGYWYGLVLLKIR